MPLRDQPVVRRALGAAETLGRRLQRSSSPTLARLLARGTRTIGRRRTERSRKLVHALIRWTPREVVSVPVRSYGVEFVVDLRDNLQRTLFYLGEYEGELHDLLVGDLRAGDVFADIGANVGIHALPAARVLGPLGGSVVAFEAAEDTATVLRDLAVRNGLPVDVHVVALGRERAHAELRRSPDWDPHDLGVRSLHGEGEVVGEVAVVTFDEWAEEHGLHRLDVVKIDVEGAEFDVLVGMQETLRRLRPRLLVVEVIEWFLQRAGSSSAELDAFLRDLGYEVVGPTVAEIIQGPTDELWPMAVYRPR